MPFTPNLNMERPVYGSYPDAWHGPVNYNWDIIDALFGPFSSYDLPPGTGHSHDGAPGQGPKIRHQDLSGAGALSHATIDAALSRAKVSVADTTADYLAAKLVPGPLGTVILTILSPGVNEQLEIEVVGAPAVLGDINDPSGEYGWKHFVPTSAPVAYTDNFNYLPQTSLSTCDYVVNVSSGAGGFAATGYSAVVYVDPTAGSTLTDIYAAAVACHIPHGCAQRATLSITGFDYSNLHAGDSVSFTLAVHSTAILGVFVPQSLGVVLEVNLTKILDVPPTYKMTHRIFILPDAVTRIQIFECHAHVDPEDFKGCWELSLDSNGHVYHYWRRLLVYSSQSAPPNIPGPVQAYFAALSASLTAAGEPKYGAIGFGYQYAIGMFSKFDMEIRWFSATSNADVYDEVPVCPGAAPPYGIPFTVPLPEEYFFAIPGGPGGVPGATCCGAPLVNVGDVLQADALGNPEVWVTGCNEIPVDLTPTPKGFSTNKSWGTCFPCDPPSGTPLFFNPPIGWPMEGTEGAIIIHGISPLPPFMTITSSTPGFVIIDVVWLNWIEFLLKYIILDGYGGTPVILTIANGYVPAISFVVNPFVTITNRPPTIETIDWLDTYTGTLTVATEGYEFEATFNGKGFDVGCVLSTATPGVTILGFTRNSDSEIVANILFDYDFGTSAVFTVTNPDAQTDSETVDVGYATPVIAHPMLTAPIGAAQTGTINGNFFAPGITVAPDAGSAPFVANFSFVRVDQNTLTFQLDFIGAPGSLVSFDLDDAVRGVTVNMPLCYIADALVPTLTGVTLDPTPVYNGGGQHPYKVTATGLNHGLTTWILINNYTNGEVYRTPGDIHTTARTPITTEGQFRVWCIEGPWNINVSVTKAGVGTGSLIPAFASAPPLALVLPPGSLVWSVGLEPGASGVLTITPGAGLTPLTEVSDISSDAIVLTNRAYNVGPGTVTYDYAVDADATEGAIVTLMLQNGPCDGVPVVYNGTIEKLPPTISSIEIDTSEQVNPSEGYINGEHFDPLCTINVAGNMAYVGHTWISDTRIQLSTSNGPFPGGATVEVVNPDLKTSGLFPLLVTAEPVPVVNHAELVPDVTGSIGAKLYVYGSNLYPPGAGYSFAGFNMTAVDRTLAGYLEFTGNVVGPATFMTTLTITSTANPGGYPPLDLAEIAASPGGTVVISSVGTPSAKENQMGVGQVVEGMNLDQIVLVEASPSDPGEQALQYIPIGAISPIDVTIIASTPSRLTLSMDIKKGLAYNSYDLLFYGIGPVLLATAPAAFKALASDTAADVAEPNRTLIQAAVPSGAGLPWSVAVPVGGPTPWQFGDGIVANGWTIQAGTVYNPGTQTWTVNGLNGLVGAKRQLKINRPAIPGGEETNIRFPDVT